MMYVVDSFVFDDFQFVLMLDWDIGFWEYWQLGEVGVLEVLLVFEDGVLCGYCEQ